MIRAGIYLKGNGLHRQALGVLAGLGLLLATIPAYGQAIGTLETPDIPTSTGGAGQADPFTGTMTYQLPLKVLPGRHGMEPNLTLVYRSSNPNDPAGHGWKLELGMIERNKRLSQDNSTFWTNNLYTMRLNGVTQELVCVMNCSDHTAAPAEYRAVIEGPFTRFIRKQGGDSIMYWEATDRLGRLYRFGTTNNSRVPGLNPTTLIYEWMLDRIEDPQGNYLTATYTGADTGSYKAYLTEIAYTGKVGGLPTTRAIKVYNTTTGADDYAVRFPLATGSGHLTVTVTGKLYTFVVIKDGANLVRAYKLTQSGTPKLLTQVQECGKDATDDGAGNVTCVTTLPPITFAYTSSGDPVLHNLLTTINNGLGGVTTIEYEKKSISHSGGTYETAVAMNVKINDGLNHEGTTNYVYASGVFYNGDANGLGKEFRGFRHTTLMGPGTAPNQRVTDMWFLQGNGLGPTQTGDDPTVATSVMRGKPYEIKVSDSATPSATVFSDTKTTYQGLINISNPSFNPPQQVDVSFPSTPHATKIVYDYDTTYGNVTREQQFGDTDVTTDDRTIVRTFASPNTTKWIVGLPGSEEIFVGTGLSTPPPIGNRKAATYFCYDDATPCDGTPQAMPSVGNLTSTGQRLDPTSSGSTSVVTTTLAYDTYGNLISLKDANSPNNERTFIYDTTATYLLRANHPQLVPIPPGAYKSTTCRYHVDTTYYGVTKGTDPGPATLPCTANPVQEQVLPPNPNPLIPTATGFYGLPAKIRDENEKDTAYEYDALGRDKTALRPDNSKTTTEYLNFGSLSLPDLQRIVRKDYDVDATTVLRTTTTFFDGLQRTYKTETSGPDGKTIVAQTNYDLRGLVSSHTLPYFSTDSPDKIRTRTFAYEALGRVLQTINPDGSTTKACYQDWNTVTVDANGHVRREERDAFGRIATVKEYTGAADACVTNPSSPNSLYATTTYEYDVLNNLTKVKDAQNNETTMIYDGANHRTQLVDPDTGTTGAVYHPAGQLKTQTDAKTQTIRLTQLDRWNRPFQKDYGTSDKSLYNGDVNYQYDEDNRNGYGRVTTVCQGACSVGTKMSLSYDALGRLQTTVENVSGTPPYTTGFSYDGLGRLKTVTYPDSSVVTYTYNGPVLACAREGGTSCADATVKHAEFTEYNALGQPGKVTFANGVTTKLTYHDQNFRLLRRLTTQGTNTYQDMRYGYDPGGNVTAIVDGPATQSFRYDDLDRLISATGPYSPQATRIFGYDKIGNLTLHCTLGDLVYPSSGPGSTHPHAVISSLSGSYTYDNNGNLLTAPGGFSITPTDYDFENRPTKITKGVTTTNLTYHDLLGRVTKSVVGGATTTYVGRWYECTGGTCRKYIFAGDQRIALKEGSAVTYVHSDHLGSSSVLTNGTDGNKNEQVTYYPFGQTRTDTDGAGNPISGFRYKYTDQEFDDTTGLYFYKARYYDPVLGRFIQADAIAPSLRNSQAGNRYTYAQNNPLKYIDPSGYDVLGADQLSLANAFGYNQLGAYPFYTIYNVGYGGGTTSVSATTWQPGDPSPFRTWSLSEINANRTEIVNVFGLQPLAQTDWASSNVSAMNLGEALNAAGSVSFVDPALLNPRVQGHFMGDTPVPQSGLTGAERIEISVRVVQSYLNTLPGTLGHELYHGINDTWGSLGNRDYYKLYNELTAFNQATFPINRELSRITDQTIQGMPYAQFYRGVPTPRPYTKGQVIELYDLHPIRY